MVFLTVHIMACVWVRVGISTEESWIFSNAEAFNGIEREITPDFFIVDHSQTSNELAAHEKLNFKIYLITCYMVTTTLTTVGYGDICISKVHASE
jgi:hypothetical protein